MNVYSTSLVEETTSTTSASLRENEFSDVLDAALDPALFMCGRMAEMRNSTWDRAVFGVNCVEAALGALEGFDFVEELKQKLVSVEEGHVETLTGEHVRLPH